MLTEPQPRLRYCSGVVLGAGTAANRAIFCFLLWKRHKQMICKSDSEKWWRGKLTNNIGIVDGDDGQGRPH